MSIIKAPSLRSICPGSEVDPVRPERFAWDEQESLVLFGVGPRGHVKAQPKDVDEKEVTAVEDDQNGRSRILLAGQHDREFRDLGAALQAAREAVVDRFVIVERSLQVYMQALCTEAGWILEKRKGHGGAHFRAIAKRDEVPGAVSEDDLLARMFSSPPAPRLYLSFAQVLEAMLYYHCGLHEPKWLQWEQIDVS